MLKKPYGIYAGISSFSQIILIRLQLFSRGDNYLALLLMELLTTSVKKLVEKSKSCILRRLNTYISYTLHNFWSTARFDLKFF